MLKMPPASLDTHNAGEKMKEQSKNRYLNANFMLIDNDANDDNDDNDDDDDDDDDVDDDDVNHYDYDDDDDGDEQKVTNHMYTT